MTREDLAKDILLAYIRSQDRTVVEIPFADLAADAVDQADALLEALGAKEAQASWLSKEMRTPAKGFPVIKEGSWESIATAPDNIELTCRREFGPSFVAIHGRTGWYSKRGDIAPPTEWYTETPV